MIDENAIANWTECIALAPDFHFFHRVTMVGNAFGWIATVEGKTYAQAVPVAWILGDPRWFELLLVYGVDDLRKARGLKRRSR
jgi:hypothetical protein